MAFSLDGPTLPASTYTGKDSRTVQPASPDSDENEKEGFLPMAFDPNPAPPRLPPISRKRVPQAANPSPPVVVDSPPPRDYFAGRTASKPHRDALREGRPSSSRSVSTERDPTMTPQAAGQPKASPHIAYQEKGRMQKRATSGQSTPANQTQSPTVAGAQEKVERPKPQTLNTGSFTLGHGGEGFKLQDVPKSKRAGSRSSSSKENKSPVMVSPVEGEKAERALSASPVSADSPHSGVNPFDDPRRREAPPSGPAPAPPKFPERPARGDSLAATALKANQSKRSTPEPPTPTNAGHTLHPGHSRQESATSAQSAFVDAQSTISRNDSQSKSLDSPQVRASFDAPPPRASSRPSAPSKSVANDDFTAPRLPPPPPPGGHNRAQDSVSSLPDTRSEEQRSPALRSAGLPKHSADGTFSMEEEMARILRGERAQRESTHANADAPTSVLRRVSNAVKHGRSFSDRGLPSSTKSNGSGNEPSITSPMTISSPLMTSPTGKDNVESLRASLRRAQQRITELETSNASLEEKVNASPDIRQVNSELREKRTTMAFLDTQREMVVRELEVMTNHLGKVKDQNQPLDLPALKDSVLQELAESITKLKDHMGQQIEDLMRKRNELTDEIGQLIQMKDKGFQEYESLSSKNLHLEQANATLLQNIQDMYKSNRGANGKANGLGIYHPDAKLETPGPHDVRNLNLVSTDSSMPNLLHETEAEPATVLTAPQVVNIRKGQPKKFNWRKGGEKMAKNVTKGLKGAFAGETKDRYEIGMPYGATQSQAMPGSEQSSVSGKQNLDGKGGAGFGFFAQKNGGLKAGQVGTMKNGSQTNLSAPSNDPSGKSSPARQDLICETVLTHAHTVLFGTELELRCEFEKRIIPAIVSRCIDEVESRGMDMEGVYRKSGGSGQVKGVQAGFEKDSNYDISDPDLDIHAVTSALKQYFRKLPIPLITYEVYEPLLEAGQIVGDKEKQVIALRNAVNDLPEHHRNCLEFLVQHLARVMAMQEKNLMTGLNLAVVFAPTIMRPLSIEREMSDMLAQRTAVQALLELHEGVFVEEE